MDSSATHYLDQIELFQRQQTTAAFKLAGGVEPSSYSLVKASKQLPIPQAFISKIVKAFMDTLYAFLDGLVLLASDASPIATGKRLASEAIPSIGPNSLDLLDLTDSVRVRNPFIDSMLQLAQDTRILVVISNFGHLSQAIIPSMLTQLEGALGTSITDERQVK